MREGVLFTTYIFLYSAHQLIINKIHHVASRMNCDKGVWQTLFTYLSFVVFRGSSLAEPSTMLLNF